MKRVPGQLLPFLRDVFSFGDLHEHVPPRNSQRLSARPQVRQESRRDIESHLVDFEAKLRAGARTADHIGRTLKFIRTICAENRWVRQRARGTEESSPLVRRVTLDVLRA